MEVDAVDAALLVVLRLADVVVADDALRVVLRVEETDDEAREEERHRHFAYEERNGRVTDA